MRSGEGKPAIFIFVSDTGDASNFFNNASKHGTSFIHHRDTGAQGNRGSYFFFFWSFFFLLSLCLCVEAPSTCIRILQISLDGEIFAEAMQAYGLHACGITDTRESSASG